LPQGPRLRKRTAGCKPAKTGRTSLGCRSFTHSGPIRFPNSFDRADHGLEFGHFALLVEFDGIDAP